MRYLEFFKRQFLLTHVSGIPIRIDYRWFFVLVFMTWLTAKVFSSYVGNDLHGVYSGVVCRRFYFSLQFCFTKSRTLLAAKMETIEVVEIVLHPFGGLARMRREPDTPRAEFRIALAGPAAVFCLPSVFLF